MEKKKQNKILKEAKSNLLIAIQSEFELSDEKMNSIKEFFIPHVERFIVELIRDNEDETVRRTRMYGKERKKLQDTNGWD
jgi:hypothetical protein